ncbi:hypothetical protein GPECTOR_2g1264 [Gonium pectorale]|uniref:HotDog ACOT-type domain-containing protein n=1 Tax=Gonium pectorale TaxID=33097 RepID=A0A150H0Z8_GONPE|nr:hypothetical protein GPECTOR_2g1264 [Gonium pectorale]|eukprot:KXZ55714.1 hypothetical protein GPECTOR_2g1264 [Gonium pectorale]
MLRLEEPAGLKESPLFDAEWYFPFSFGALRRGGHGIVTRYKRGPALFAKGSGEPANSLAASAASPAAVDELPVPERPPSDSYLEITFPFSKDAQLREHYQRFFTDHMRFGLLLEDLDTLAGNIAARHAGVTNRVLLTASIDRLSWLRDPAVGEVVWAGRSSMEVLIELASWEHDARRPQWHFVGVARFVLVVRTPDRTSAASVPALVPQTERERALFEQGKVHMELRQRRRESHWARKPPTADEVTLVHDLIRNHHLHRVAAHHHHHHSGTQLGAVPMQRTTLHSACLMHSQDRNIFNVIFGGHLLRLAYEHAFATAALHAGEYCDSLSMDDVSFLQPVPIGTLLRLTGQVVYTEGPVVRVHVRASKVEPGAPEQSVVTNVFSFAFVSPSGPVRRVVPEAMVEAMEYLMGHRQHRQDEASLAMMDAAARSRL